jgi:6-phospho-beta-glucosidase
MRHELMSAIYNDKRIIMHVILRETMVRLRACRMTVRLRSVNDHPFRTIPLNVEPFPEDVLRLIQLMKSWLN